ncbi:pre-mRNA 3-end-processing factor fip1l1 [Acarospora aff. strigata]|nr:pre-mRNA 3-end-processing factor fip1l1 [Acarospora aff. strigata]
MEEEDDDFYAPNDDTPGVAPAANNATLIPPPAIKQEKNGDELEEGEEEGEEVEEDESDSDIDIITERKDGSKPEPPAQPSRHIAIKNIPSRNASTDHGAKTPVPAVKADTPTRTTQLKSGAEYPAVRTSTIDIDAKPIFLPTGKPITEIDMDADLSEEDKPWRRPGSDITDYFNYGFDEFTWASYCLKQDTLRKEVSDQKKQMEDMQSFLGMPGMPGPPQAAQPAMPMPAMSGMGDMPPEMQQMMATMMSQGMDPSQMDPAMFMQQMQQMQQGGQGNGPGGNQGAGFGGAGQAFGAQGPTQQQMGFGFDQGMGGDRNRGGNFAGRGRGTQNRRNW